MNNEDTLEDIPEKLRWLEQEPWSDESFWARLCKYLAEKERLYEQGYAFSKEDLDKKVLSLVADRALPILQVCRLDLERGCLQSIGGVENTSVLHAMCELQAIGLARDQPFSWSVGLIKDLMARKMTPWGWFGKWAAMVEHQYQKSEALVEILVDFLKTPGARQMSWGARVHGEPYLAIVALWTAIELNNGASKYSFRGHADPDHILDTFAPQYSSYWPAIRLLRLPFEEAYQLAQLSKDAGETLPQELVC